MTKSTVFTSNKSQAVRLPKPVAFPADVRQVEITKIGRSRLIAPVGHTWDAFFDEGGTGDKSFTRGKQPKSERREPL